MDDIAVSVENVSKDFVLPHERINSVKGIVTSISKGNPWKAKETQHALKNISFQIKKGEFFGIVGRNGSGKSTLLKILAGIYQPTAGSVHTNGKLVPFIELGVGFNGELTGRENVYLNGAMLGFSKKEIAAMYDDIVSFAELERFMDQKLKNYSSGMQVRLAFSMATRAQADILVIDEVLAVGDADFQRKCFDYFSQLKQKNVTVIFVSHDMAAVREYCDRAMLVENSVAVDIGATDSIAEKYLRLFINSAESADETSSQSRWGDQSAKATRVVSRVTPEQIEIKTAVVSQNGLDSPSVGFRIRDAAGKEVTGTNTRHENSKIARLLPNKKIEVAWQFPNVLRDGKYYIDIAVLYSNDVAVADWWNDAGSFSVRKERHIPYTLDPGFKTTISEGSSKS